MPGTLDDDQAHMRAALALARRTTGSTWPNPGVGCVLVQGNRVIARAATAPGGRPHAEAAALALAGEAARGATTYVTLEPCSHHGQTPPCADALIAAGIARVVVGCIDPDSRVSGAGLARLREAGIEVTEGVLRTEAEAVHAPFLTRIRLGRPLVTLKLASTLDGRIATASGESQWITGPAARRAAHALRGRHDATLVGIGTVLADDPALTCRIPGFRQTPPVRIILDSDLRTPPNAVLVRTAMETPTWIMHRPEAEGIALQAAGVRLLAIPEMNIETGLQAVGSAGLTSILAEGGAAVAASLLRADLIDRLAWFHAPTIMGGDGWPAVSPLGATTLAAMPRFQRISVEQLGDDLLSIYERRMGETHQDPKSKPP